MQGGPQSKAPEELQGTKPLLESQSHIQGVRRTPKALTRTRARTQARATGAAHTQHKAGRGVSGGGAVPRGRQTKGQRPVLSQESGAHKHHTYTGLVHSRTLLGRDPKPKQLKKKGHPPHASWTLSNDALM